MRLRVPALLLTLLYATICGAAPATQPNSQPPAPRAHGIKVERDIPYVPNGDPAQVLDLYLPQRPSAKPLPLIVSVHGGGWSSGSKAGCPGIGLVQQGYAAASIEFRSLLGPDRRTPGHEQGGAR